MADQTTQSVDTPQSTVLRKVMWRLVPFLSLLYAFCIIDRGNVGYAALQMKGDLHFSDVVYGFGAGIFFIGYFIFEVPSNLIMERMGARLWIARIMLSWGAVSACMMFVRSPITFYSLRFLLGIAEAGFYPGIILYFTYWVPGEVRARVLSRFLSLQAMFSLASPLLGGLLLKMNGIGGLRGWQWLFLVEGIPSFLLGFVVFRALPNGPNDAQWLSNEEKSWISASMKRDAEREQQIHHLTLRTALTEPRILILCLIFFITSTGGNAIGFFGPQLIKARSHGLWSDSMVTAVNIIPAIVGAIAMVIAAGHSDRSGNRRYHVAIGYLIAGIAFIACVSAPTAWWVIAAFSLNALGERIAAGSYWAVTSNLLGARAAAGGIAMINSVGNLGGFVGPTLMGEIKKRANGGFGPGLYTAGFLVITGAGVSLFLRKPPASSPVEPHDIEPDTDVIVAGVETFQV
jgi:ACS family tartrate transporter-like MFS transporter